jgi:hypothetical protein
MRSLVIGVVLVLAAGPAPAQVPTPGRFAVTLEGAVAWQERNDVRIPPDSGTEFSVVDLIGRDPTPSARVEVVVEATERQQLRFVYAPLRFEDRGILPRPVAFAGRQFPPGLTEAAYRFSSYRGTWRYRVYQGSTWTWRIGATGFVRDARVALAQSGVVAEDTDVGFVPLGHISGDARLSDRWHVAVELDGAAAPQGRAFDVAATVNYRPRPRLTLSAGYRTIEGGADVDTVFAFAWINAAVARIGVRF